MALKSISLATSQIQDAIDNLKIGIETSVTITDNLYTADHLKHIIAETNKTITLTYTAAGTPISASAEDLVAILAQVNKYTGPLTVTGNNPTAEELNYIAKKTTGIVTATLDAGTPISKATVDALKDVSSSDVITFVPSQPLVEGKSDLEALVALNKKLPNTDWTTNVDDFKGTASEVAAIKAALKVVDTANVNITSGQISAADANALVVASEGTVTAAIKDGSVAATLKALKDVSTVGSALSFKSTDKTADAKALFELAALVTEDFSSVQTITSKAADIGEDGKNVTDVVKSTGLVPDADVTITNGTISAVDAGLISLATAGKVTATITPDTAAIIAHVTSGLGVVVPNEDKNDALNITVNGEEASVADLNTIDAQTALKVKVTAATVTAANFIEFEDIYVKGKDNFSNLGDENITIAVDADPTKNINSAQADIVAKATSKVVTATVASATADLLVANLKNANAKDAFTLTVTGPATAKDLLTLDGKTSVALNVVGVTTITGTAADVKKVYEAAGIATKGDEAITLTGTVKAADANYIALNTTGVVTATIAADTAAKLDAVLKDATTNNYTLTVNGATASVTELNTLAAKTTGKITVDAKEITGAVDDLVTLYANAGGKFANLENENVKVTDVEAVATEVDKILETTGVVTATVTAGSAEDLVDDLTNATAKDKLTLKVTNVATTAADLFALDNKTAIKVNATAITTGGISGSAADVKKLLASKGVELAKNVAITLSDSVVKAADVSAVAKATSGVVSAEVEAGTAAALNKALTDKDVNALKLTVNGATATAKDLISLDGKTSANITLNVGAITGDLAEITKVFTNASTFINEEKTAATISGTEIAEDVNAIALLTTGVVTATIAAGTANYLNTELSETDVNAYKLTVIGNDADAAHLVSLVAKTSVTVNAADIKNIIADNSDGAAEVKAAYDANTLKKISGLGNETVDLTDATDANVSLVKDINDYTTGLITLDTLDTTAGNFSLSQLGDLKGITGLATIDAENGAITALNLNLADLFASNDNATFNIAVKLGGEDTLNLLKTDAWVVTGNDLNGNGTYTNGTKVITVTGSDDTHAVVIA